MRKPRREIPMNTYERAHKHAKKYDRNNHRNKTLMPPPEAIEPDYDPDYPCDGCVTHCRACKPRE